MGAEGIECPKCNRARAPTLPECPYCRASIGSSLGESARPLLGADDGEARSLTSLPSRMVLSLVPLLILATTVEMMALRGTPHAYASGAAAIDGTALLIAVLVSAGFLFLGERLGQRVRIDGQSPSRIALLAVALVGLLPASFLPIDHALDQANAFGGDTTRVQLPCTWTEAEQLRDAQTGVLVHVTVTATCTTPEGHALPVHMSLDAASVVDGTQFTVPMWRGRWVGWFYTLDPNAAVTRAQ